MIWSYRRYDRMRRYFRGLNDYDLYDEFKDIVMQAYDFGKITADRMTQLLTYYQPREEQIKFLLDHADFDDINYQDII